MEVHREPDSRAKLPPMWDPLARERHQAADETAAAFRPEIDDLHRTPGTSRSAHLERLETLTDRIWKDYQERFFRVCGSRAVARYLCRGDMAVRQGPPEFMDRPGYPELLRKIEIFQLHQLNRMTGVYRAASRALGELLERVPDRFRSRGFLDIASGFGGFPVFLAGKFPAVPVTGSDIQPAYVTAATSRAAGLGNARFRVLNALNMDDCPDGSYCAASILQAVHHFRPGQLARIIHEGLRVSCSGMVVVDAVRSPVLPVLLATGTMFVTWNPFFAADATWSALRMYHLAELELIARVAAPEAAVEAGRVEPAFNVIRVLRPPVAAG